MSNRRVIKLESMFKRIAKQSEMATVDRLYEQGRKGPAVRYMTDRIAEVFFALLDEKGIPEPYPTDGFTSLGQSIIKPFN